jgi:hypothetical protein
VKILAEALAHCYWKAEVDANDVEFVLAPPTARKYVYLKPTPTFRVLGEKLTKWMLDFGSVRHITQDVDGIAQAARAFWRSDPYFPRHYFNGQTDFDRKLWKLFLNHFLQASKDSLLEKMNGKVSDALLVLPAYWVSLVEGEGEGAKREAAEYNRMLSDQKVVNGLVFKEFHGLKGLLGKEGDSTKMLLGKEGDEPVGPDIYANTSTGQ